MQGWDGDSCCRNMRTRSISKESGQAEQTNSIISVPSPFDISTSMLMWSLTFSLLPSSPDCGTTAEPSNIVASILIFSSSAVLPLNVIHCSPGRSSTTNLSNCATGFKSAQWKTINTRELKFQSYYSTLSLSKNGVRITNFSWLGNNPTVQ